MTETITTNNKIKQDRNADFSSINWTKRNIWLVLGSDVKISEDLILKSKSLWNYKWFMVIDDNYVLINDGKSLVSEIEKCGRLRKSWVNYCGPISYKEHDWKYYFLEHRAPWLQLDFYNYDDINFDEAFQKYFSYLKLLSNASQEQYNKFFSDIELMKKESLRPDYCSLWNLFYDKRIWFSFIDVYPCNIRPWDSKLSVPQIFNMILNPKFSYKNLNIIPKEEVDKYNKTIKIIYEKIIKSLKLYNYPDDEIKNYLSKWIHKFSSNECICYKNIEKYVEEHYNPNEIIIWL